MILYFAYGSNLLTERLRARCPSVRVEGRARLAGYRVGFAKYSWMDGSGKATILEAEAQVTEGVLFSLDRDDLTRLDAIEGVGKGYERRDGLALEHRGGAVEAVSYIASDPRHGQRPFDWYLALILAGVAEHGLGGAVAALHAEPYDIDGEHGRPGRIAAVEALHAAGHHDWPALLPVQEGPARSSSS